jgi:predicted phosphate transport protein (TIGR00153 family)
MLNMLKPRKNDQVFFELFSSVIADTCAAAEKLEDLFKNYDESDQKILTLEELEHKCDKTVHNLISHLNHSFITPFDREDIFLITKVIDNIMDNIESTAFGLKLLNIKKIREESFEMTALIVKCSKELSAVIGELKNMKNSKTIQTRIIEVNRIENQGDEAYRKIIRNLFSTEEDTLEIIKWKEIYEYMEKTLDACEDVANIIEGIVSKNA